MNTTLRIIVGLGAFAMASGSMAAQTNNSDTQLEGVQVPVVNAGFYLNGNFGYAFIDRMDGSDGGFTWSAAAGYQFNRYIAAELGYLGLPDVTLDGRTEAKNVQGFYLAAKAMYPLGAQLDAFVKVGVARMMDQTQSRVLLDDPYTKNTRYTGVFGAGIDYGIDTNVALTGQILATLENGPIPAAYSGMVGITYHFAS